MKGESATSIVLCPKRNARENWRQGIYDLRYLRTLADAAAKLPQAHPAGREADRFLDWLRARFRDNYYYEASIIDQNYLDLIRRQAAELTRAAAAE